MKNPKFQQAIVWGSMAGMNAVDIYSQLASGAKIEDVIGRSAVKIAGQIGAIKGIQAGFALTKQKFDPSTKLVSNTNKDFTDLTTNQFAKASTKITKLTTMNEEQSIQFLAKHPEYTKIILNNSDDFAVTSKKLTEGQLLKEVEAISKKIDSKLFDSVAVSKKIDAVKSQMGELTEAEFNDKLNKILAEAKADPLGLKENLDDSLDLIKQSGSTYSDKYLEYHKGMGSQTMTAVKTADDLLSEIQIANIEAITKQPLINITKTLSEATSPVQMTKIANTIGAEILADALSKASPYQLLNIVPNISTEQFVNILPQIKSESLSNIFTTMSTEQLNASVPKISEKNLLDILSKVGAGTASLIISRISSNQFIKILQTSATGQSTGVMQTISAGQLIGLMQGMSTSQLTTVMQGISTGQLTGIMQTLVISQTQIQTYLHSGTLSNIKNAPPALIKRILDAKYKRNKKEMKEQKSTMFNVQLQYSSSTEQYKIKSNSFHGAAREAISRRKSTQIPLSVMVKQMKEQNN
jgi:hypothetical protein